MVLNGTRFGGADGTASSIFSLGADDYWSEFEVHGGDWIDYIRFKSANGTVLEGGGDKGSHNPAVTGVRILRIGGSCGDLLDSVEIEYVPNYGASKKVSENEAVALDFRPGGVTIVDYQESTVRTTEVYDKITQFYISLEMSASAEGEYYAKFAASTKIKTVGTSKVEIQQSTEKTLTTATSVTDTVADDEIAVLIGRVNVMQDMSGNYWVYPNGSQPGRAKVKLDNVADSLGGVFDFTAGLQVQTGLGREEKYGERSS